MKFPGPHSLVFAVMRMDPVTMVQHFNDPDLTARAQAINPRKYLVLLNAGMGLPLPNNAWFPFLIHPIANVLRHPDPVLGITPDMAIPIHPNVHNSRGHEPIRTVTPFPFPNCYHWFHNSANVRVRRKDDLFDDSVAVHIAPQEFQAIRQKFADDYRRINEFLAANPPPVDAPKNNDTESMDDALVQDDLDPAAGSASSDAEDGQDDDLEDVIYNNVLGFGQDLLAEQVPLVDLWYELTDHLTADTIPSPVDFYKERDAIKAIIGEGRARYPYIAPPCINEEVRRLMSDSASQISEYSARLDDAAPTQPPVSDTETAAQHSELASNAEATAGQPASAAHAAVVSASSQSSLASVVASTPTQASGTAEAIARKINLILGETKETLSKKTGRPVEDIYEDEVDAVVIHGDDIDSLQGWQWQWDQIFAKNEIVFARTSPQHKLEIVKRAQALGHIVGVTGDGEDVRNRQRAVAGSSPPPLCDRQPPSIHISTRPFPCLPSSPSPAHPHLLRPPKTWHSALRLLTFYPHQRLSPRAPSVSHPVAHPASFFPTAISVTASHTRPPTHSQRLDAAHTLYRLSVSLNPPQLLIL
ncbi:hypothetical protein BN946_scf184969.g68 [Trametes cinnabarina]|uniref:Uncharacterized protein n=1 Tax=Pycnoporus cinnabarinus TaxID=5643 RepID=A0A060ST46_PYCCI|nr:hypothetical protein BN946_scf184969.g68 [Trametes cinnabarina]